MEGEGRLIVKKLAGGAYRVRKVIEFHKQKGRGPAQVERRWETMAAPPCGPELRRILPQPLQRPRTRPPSEAGGGNPPEGGAALRSRRARISILNKGRDC